MKNFELSLFSIYLSITIIIIILGYQNKIREYYYSIWYFLFKPFIHRKILNQIYQFLYVDIRPTSFDYNYGNGIQTSENKWGGSSTKNINTDNVNTDSINEMKKNASNRKHEKYYLLTNYDRYCLDLEFKRNNFKSNNERIQYYGRFLFYEKYIEPYLEHKLINRFSLQKYGWLVLRLSSILNSLEIKGYIRRINGVLYEPDFKVSFEYHPQNIYNDYNKGYYDVTKEGKIYLSHTWEDDKPNMAVIMDIFKTFKS